MYFETDKLSESKIEKLVGHKVSGKVRGTAALFLRSIKADELPDGISDSKMILDLRTHGLLIHAFKSDKRWVFAIPAKSIIKVEMRGGEETVNPSKYSIMGILLKLGVSLRIARYFSGSGYEYRVTPVVLLVQTREYDMILEGNGYQNKSLEYFTSQLNALQSE